MTEHIHQAAVTMERGGAGVAVGSWLMAWLDFLGDHSVGIMTVVGLIGAITGVLGFLLNWWYRRLENERQEREHLARMDVLRAGDLPNA